MGIPIVHARCGWLAASALALCACGGGDGGTSDSAPPPGLPLTTVSGPTPFGATCSGPPQNDVLYRDAEVEPSIAVNPRNPQNLIGYWQQDRWSDGGAQGLIAAASFDGGATWTRQAPPFSVCAGGSYARASDPWVSFAPDGSAYLIALAFTGDLFQAGSGSAVLVSRSSDGGASWSTPVSLIADGAQAFNDKEAITADPTDPHYVYAVWDRLVSNTTGPTWFARTADGGATWETARPIYDPGANSQTIGNQIVVLPDGTLVLFFTQIDYPASGGPSAHYGVMRSTDHGDTWSAPPVKLADALAIGARDPATGAPVRDGANLISVAASASGVLYAVWQDARFSGGARDGIAFAQSSDGGSTWSVPVQINAVPAVQAFTPTVRVGADGKIAVSYFDFRDDHSQTDRLATDYWLTASGDGVHWNETRVSGPFDLRQAPRDNSGWFLGDYQALAALPGAFLAFFVRANADPGNRTDVYVAPLSYAQARAAMPVKALRPAAPLAITPEFAAKVAGAIQRELRESSPPKRLRRTRAGRG
jgi:hypothetical protein